MERLADSMFGPVYYYEEPVAIYTEMMKIDSLQRLMLKNNVRTSVELPSKYEYIENVGIDHNLILENTISKEAVKSIPEETIPIDSATLNYLKSPVFVNQYQSIQDQILNSIDEIGRIDLDLYFKNPETHQVSALTKKIMELFLDIYTQYPDGYADIDTIVNYYIQAIEQSQLTSEEKENLYRVFLLPHTVRDFGQNN